jgi:hypothetical protein
VRTCIVKGQSKQPYELNKLCLSSSPLDSARARRLAIGLKYRCFQPAAACHRAQRSEADLVGLDWASLGESKTLVVLWTLAKHLPRAGACPFVGAPKGLTLGCNRQIRTAAQAHGGAEPSPQGVFEQKD